MKKISFEDALILRSIQTARFLARLLPRRVCLGTLWTVGAAIYAFSERRNVAYKNLRAAFAAEKSRRELKHIARRSFQNMALSMGEMLRLPDMNLAYVRRNIEFVGVEKYEPFLKEKKGVIFLTAHYGNWELLNVASRIVDYPMVVLARAQKHPRSDAYLNSIRSCKGSQVIRKGMPVREILKALKTGKVLGILSDQDGGKNGTFVRFFGRQSSSPNGVVTFAMRTGAPIFPSFDVRQDWIRHRIEVKDALVMPPVDTPPEEAERIVLQQFADVLEAQIRRHPDRWLWAHRRWKSTPNRSVLILSDGKTGHLNQSMTVLEAFREERRLRGAAPDQTQAKVVVVQFKNKFFENFIKILSIILNGALPFKHGLMKSVLKPSCYETLMQTYADVVISCGSSLAVVNVCVKNENQAKSVVVMKPPFLKGFDAMIVPRHDKIKRGDSIFVTDRALSLISAPTLAQEGQRLQAVLNLPRFGKKIGLLVGGDTKTLRFSPGVFQKIIGEIERFLSRGGAQILATSSRRTPAWADDLLKKTWTNSETCGLLVIANESNREGVVPGILGLADLVIVSAESLSMVSEAVAAGKPTVVFIPCEKKALKAKVRRFLDGLAQEKQIIEASSENMVDAIRQGMGHLNGKSNLSHDAEILQQAVRRIL